MQHHPASQGFVCWCGLQNCPYHPRGPPPPYGAAPMQPQLPPLGAYDFRREPDGGQNGYYASNPYQSPFPMAGYPPGPVGYSMPPPGYGPPMYSGPVYYGPPGYGPPPYPMDGLVMPQNADPRHPPGGAQPPYGGVQEEQRHRGGDAKSQDKRRATKAPGPSRRAGRDDPPLGEEQQRLLAQELAKPRWKEPKQNDADAAWNAKVQEWKDQQRRDIMERREAKELEQRWERQQAEIARLVTEIERVTNDGRRVREKKSLDAIKGRKSQAPKALPPRHLPPLEHTQESQSLPSTPTPAGGRRELPNSAQSAPIYRSPYDGFTPAAMMAGNGVGFGLGYPPSAPYPAFGANPPPGLPALPREHLLQAQRQAPMQDASPSGGPRPALYIEHPQFPHQAPVMWHVPPPERNIPTPRAMGPSALPQASAPAGVPGPGSPSPHYAHGPYARDEPSFASSVSSPTSAQSPSDVAGAAVPYHSSPPPVSASPPPPADVQRRHYGVTPPPVLQQPQDMEWDGQSSSTHTTPNPVPNLPVVSATPIQHTPVRPRLSPAVGPPPAPGTAFPHGDFADAGHPSPLTTLGTPDSVRDAQRQEAARQRQQQLLAAEEEDRRYLVTDERVARGVVSTARSRVALHIVQALKAASNPSPTAVVATAASVPQEAEEAVLQEDERVRDRQRALRELKEREARALARLKELSSGMI
eukprot:GGOE01014878.1.p1 GENE.GGOE01014878.1~~GGOE01014878.1.p1  ORF type:complete len:697 (+),score=92.05 GGOE01014878.1:137-2227(+)